MGALDNLIVTTAMPAILGPLHQPNGLAFLIDAYITSWDNYSSPISSIPLRNVLYGFVVPMVLGSILGGILLPKLSYRFFLHCRDNLHGTWVSPPS